MNTRTKLVAVLALAVALLTCPLVGGETEKANQADKLETLLAQRRDTLQQLVQVATEEYRHGITGFESVDHEGIFDASWLREEIMTADRRMIEDTAAGQTHPAATLSSQP